ncbi:hypothetical protein H4N58_00360 [Mumia sp. ZJ1417]|uniref:hypothetical protein n=1 Tax=Mumia sp. ZJ1417 TaxID=2708082 RepID=UPI001421446A|nr:hypothetical protein [Mumia sp. ZJ1417]QMW66486.1 hypothetical protein H4N58_00360 [Mumia sp. ZJ1417]
MNEMQLLEQMRSDVEADALSLRRARRRLLRHTLAVATPRRRRGRRVLIGAAVTFALATLLLSSALVGDRDTEVTAVAVLERAVSAEATAPQPSEDEWVHVTSETTRWSADAEKVTLQEHWVPGAGQGHVVFRNPAGDVTRRRLERPAIMDDPDASTGELLTWLGRDNGDLRGAEAAFERAIETLAAAETPSAFRARLFEALTQVDGVRIVSDRTDFHGYRAVIVARAEGDYETQLAFDRATGAFLGFQSVSHDDGVDRPSYSTLLTTEVVQDLPPRAEPEKRTTNPAPRAPATTPTAIPSIREAMDAWLDVASCLTEHGWGVRVDYLQDGIALADLPQDQADQFHADQAACEGRLGPSPVDVPMTPERAGELYDHQVRMRTCIAGFGYDTSKPPSRQEYISDYMSERPPWSPYADLPPEAAFLTVVRECPQTPW